MAAKKKTGKKAKASRKPLTIKKKSKGKPISKAPRKTAKKKSRLTKARTLVKSSAAKVAPKKPVGKVKISGKKAISAKPTRSPRREREADPEEYILGRPRSRGREDSAGQSGDLQGLSDAEGADSESVDELLEEGNSFEAGVIKGVEDAGNNEEGGEVHTHEVPEDDVPEEYLDEE
jgi:hypothetical protein